MIQILVGIALLLALFFVLSAFGAIVFSIFEFLLSKFLYVIIGVVVIGWIFHNEKK